MSLHTDPTHDPALRSWVASANGASSDFPVQNLPYGCFRRAGSAAPWRIGIAIGDQVLDLAAARGCSGWPAALAAPLEPRRRCPSNSTRRLAADRRDARAR